MSSCRVPRSPRSGVERPPRLAWDAALRHCVIASFDDVAREVGELCGRTRTTDICDAHVALVAAARADVLYTSDPRDLRRLLVACGKRLPLIVRC